MTRKSLNPILAAGALLALPATLSFGAMALDPAPLPGAKQSDAWPSLTLFDYPGYGGFPGSGAWPGPMQSATPNAGNNGDAYLTKVANGPGGGPYPASGSIYYGGFSAEVNYNGGTLAVTDSTPVSGLSNIVFQIQIGEAWTYDFLNHELPTLSYTAGSESATGVAATSSFVLEKFYNGTVEMPTGDEDIFINTYLLQWDLSGVTEPITSFSISFTGVQHAQLYALQLDQSDTFQAVPEPGTAALAVLGGAFVLLRRPRSRR